MHNSLKVENIVQYDIGLQKLVFLKINAYYCNMDIKDYKDFYIDQDGDIKVSNGLGSEASFITNTNKLNSRYLVANTVDEITKAIKEVAPTYGFFNLPIFKQYSIKTNKNGGIESVKMYIDSNRKIGDIQVLLEGLEFYNNNLITDLYFVSTKEEFINLLKEYNISYQIKEFETYVPILYAIRYSFDSDTRIISNFKVYYVRKELAYQYTNDFIRFYKDNLRF